MVKRKEHRKDCICAYCEYDRELAGESVDNKETRKQKEDRRRRQEAQLKKMGRRLR